MNNNQNTNKMIQMTGSDIKLNTQSINKNSQMVINYLAHIRPIYKWNSQTQKDEPITRLTDTKHSYFITINPERKELNADQLKDLFNYLKNKYAQFIYGRKWTTQFNYQYDGVVEIEKDPEKSNHLHFNIYNISANEMAQMFNFFCELTHHIYPRYLTNDTRFKCKQIDELSTKINTYRLMKNQIYNQSTEKEKAQLTNGMTAEQIGQFNTSIYMTKNEYIYFSNADFIK